jgi:hypothetical protein
VQSVPSVPVSTSDLLAEPYVVAEIAAHRSDGSTDVRIARPRWRVELRAPGIFRAQTDTKCSRPSASITGVRKLSRSQR